MSAPEPDNRSVNGGRYRDRPLIGLFFQLIMRSIVYSFEKLNQGRDDVGAKRHAVRALDAACVEIS
jgi:hypothetical protein